jgi:hypothetical protein
MPIMLYRLNKNLRHDCQFIYQRRFFIDSELDKWKYMTMLPYKPFQFPTSTM